MNVALFSLSFLHVNFMVERFFYQSRLAATFFREEKKGQKKIQREKKRTKRSESLN